jgi:hypothetical protein
MEENRIREELEETLDSQDLKYSLDVDVEEDDYITVSVSYQGESLPRLGKKLDELLERDYDIEIGEVKSEPDLPNTRSQTFTLRPLDQE